MEEKNIINESHLEPAMGSMMDHPSNPLVGDSPAMLNKNVWRNIDMSTVKLGISRDNMKLVVKCEESGNVDLKELIDPSMLILSYFSKEPQMDVLLTTRSSLLNNFKAITGFFHKINDINDQMKTLETRDNGKDSDDGMRVGVGMGYVMDIVSFCRLEAKVLDLENKVSKLEDTLKGIVD